MTNKHRFFSGFWMSSVCLFEAFPLYIFWIDVCPLWLDKSEEIKMLPPCVSPSVNKSFYSINWNASGPFASQVTWAWRMKAPVSKNTSRCNCVIVGGHGDQGNKCFRFPVWLQSRLHSRGLYQYLYKEFQPDPVGDPLLWVSALHQWTMMTLDNRTKAMAWPGLVELFPHCSILFR